MFDIMRPPVQQKALIRFGMCRAEDLSFAFNGSEAVAMMESRRAAGKAYDVVFMDYIMPVQTGPSGMYLYWDACVHTCLYIGMWLHVSMYVYVYMHGYVLCMSATQELRDRGYDGVIIGVTAQTAASEVRFFLDRGANAVLSKPLNMDTLDATLSRFPLLPPSPPSILSSI